MDKMVILCLHLVQVLYVMGSICFLNQGRLQVVLGAHVIKHASTMARNTKIKLGLTAYLVKMANRGSLKNYTRF